MTGYLSDKEQAEMLKNWWNNYGKSIAIAVVIGLVIGFGWRYWHQNTIKNEEQASLYFQAMTIADLSKDPTTAQKQAEMLWTKFPSSPYATFAALLTAKEAVLSGNYELALEKLNWTISHSKINSFKQIARIRAARILLFQKKYDDAVALLKIVDDKTFASAVAEVMGDIYSAQGRTLEAQKEYDAAKVGYTDSGIDNPFLQMKTAG